MTVVARGQFYDFGNIFAKNGMKKMALLTKITASLCHYWITYKHCFQKKNTIFSRKLAKIAEITIKTFAPGRQF
jgi:hypothetical protein